MASPRTDSRLITIDELSYPTNRIESQNTPRDRRGKKQNASCSPSGRAQVGLRSGDELEFRVSGRVITIRPKVPQAARDEYTPEQRRLIDRGIAKGLEDIRNGRTHGPFTTPDVAIAHLQTLARSRKKAARKSSQ